MKPYWVKECEGQIAVKLCEIKGNKIPIYEIFIVKGSNLISTEEYTTALGIEGLTPFTQDDIVYLLYDNMISYCSICDTELKPEEQNEGIYRSRIFSVFDGDRWV